MKQIIAIGGGGFGREIKDLKIEKYIIEQCSKQNPSVCFIPTATGDDANYIQNFYKVFNALDCNTSHIDFFKRTISLEEHINQQDIIYYIITYTTKVMNIHGIVMAQFGIKILTKNILY